jgi:hypothetical protein
MATAAVATPLAQMDVDHEVPKVSKQMLRPCHNTSRMGGISWRTNPVPARKAFL